jgi:hypothetical protein
MSPHTSSTQRVDGAKWRASFDIFDSELVISDPEGRSRIRIGVDKGGEPSIVMLSPEGKVIYRAAK